MNPQLSRSAPDAVSGFALLDTCKFHARTLEDVDTLSQFAAGVFGDAARVQPGLYALLLNAVEHGCLGMGYALKARLAACNAWEAEVRRRLSLPENRAKAVELVLARKGREVFAVITDPGPGFDWSSWIAADPARADAAHGRGIVRAKSVSFDGLTYNKQGNQVVAHCHDASDLIW